MAHTSKAYCSPYTAVMHQCQRKSMRKLKFRSGLLVRKRNTSLIIDSPANVFIHKADPELFGGWGLSRAPLFIYLLSFHLNGPVSGDGLAQFIDDSLWDDNVQHSPTRGGEGREGGQSPLVNVRRLTLACARAVSFHIDIFCSPLRQVGVKRLGK